MRKLYYFVFLALLASCSAESIVPVVQTFSLQGVSASVNDFISENSTRSAFTETEGGLSFAWSDGDQLGIFPEDNYQTCWTITNIESDKSATFNGGSWKLVDGNTYYAYYPFSADNGTTQAPIINCDYTGQTIKALNSTNELGSHDFMYASATTAEGGSTNFQLNHLGCICKIVLNLTGGRTYTKLTLSTTDDLIPAKSTYNIKTGETSVVSKVSSIDIALDNISVTADGQGIFFVMLPPCDLSFTTLSATLTYSEGSEKYAFNGKNMLAGKAYCYNESKMVNVETYTINGVEYPMPEAVDLGLPSGTKWASCDVGALSCLETGLLFAWGETYTKETFSWSNYSLCDGTSRKFKKYNKGSYVYEGDADGKKVLDDIDDCANVLIGNSWRIPTKEQMQELIDYCSWTYYDVGNDKYSGIEGFEIKRNNNSIFIRNNNLEKNATPTAYYWTSTLDEEYCFDACNLRFNYLYQDIRGIYRCDGSPVRAVLK